jgi:hypothetical protein
MTNDREEQIRRRASEIWERESHPEGQDQEHWERACEEIESEAHVSGIEAVQRTFLRGSSPDSARDSAAPGRKRKTTPFHSTADGETFTKDKQARNKPAESDASNQPSWLPRHDCHQAAGQHAQRAWRLQGRAL